jgi:hypothetical protein
MIWESEPWKVELNSLSKKIKASADCLQRNDEAQFELERAFFYAAFVIRKLIEDGKITDRTAGHSIELDAYTSLRSKKDDLIQVLVGPYKIDEEYDLLNPHKLRFSASDLAGEIVHSFALVWAINEQNDVYGAYVCSYKNQDKRALFLSFDAYCNVIERIADDEVTEHRLSKNLETGKISRIID